MLESICMSGNVSGRPVIRSAIFDNTVKPHEKVKLAELITLLNLSFFHRNYKWTSKQINN